MKTALLLVVLSVVVLLGAACSPDASVPERPVRTGDILEAFDFNRPGTFEEGVYGPASLRIVDGTYRIEVPQEGVLWGQAGTIHTDVVVEVRAWAQSSTDQARYGVMCRADPSNDGDGYLFAIRPNGSYAIMRGEGDGYQMLVAGDAPDVIAPDGENTIRAVCVGNYLALYVNRMFLTATEDGVYASGLPALAAGPGPNGTVSAVFDDLVVLDVSFAE